MPPPAKRSSGILVWRRSKRDGPPVETERPLERQVREQVVTPAPRPDVDLHLTGEQRSRAAKALRALRHREVRRAFSMWRDVALDEFAGWASLWLGASRWLGKSSGGLESAWDRWALLSEARSLERRAAAHASAVRTMHGGLWRLHQAWRTWRDTAAAWRLASVRLVQQLSARQAAKALPRHHPRRRRRHCHRHCHRNDPRWRHRPHGLTL